MKFQILGVLLLTGSAFSVIIRGDSSSSDSSEEGHQHGGGGRGPPRPRPPPGPAPAPAPSNRPVCDQHWFTSYRPQGIWCIRLRLTKADYNGAIAECAAYGGVLSGIQNEFERNLIAQEANRQTLYWNLHIGGVWLGAQRNPGSNTFSWTDGHTTGTAGLKWGPGEPDNAVAHGPQNCLQMIAMTAGYWNNPGMWQRFRNGDIDDYWCDRTEEPVTRLYVCGKRGPQE